MDLYLKFLALLHRNEKNENTFELSNVWDDCNKAIARDRKGIADIIGKKRIPEILCTVEFSGVALYDPLFFQLNLKVQVLQRKLKYSVVCNIAFYIPTL